jgi:hypothetical protein
MKIIFIPEDTTEERISIDSVDINKGILVFEKDDSFVGLVVEESHIFSIRKPDDNYYGEYSTLKNLIEDNPKFVFTQL